MSEVDKFLSKIYKTETNENLFKGMTKRNFQTVDKGSLMRDFRVDEEDGMPHDGKLETPNKNSLAS
jgi:hypothetical protein